MSEPTMTLGKNRATGNALKAMEKPSLPTKKLQMNVPEDLHRAFKMACLKQDRDMTDVTVSLIEKWIAANQ